MTSASYTLVVLLLAVHGSLQKSSPTSPTYRAALVEFHPVVYQNDPAKTLEENTIKMENYIKQAAKKNTDIIVFPELLPTTVALPSREYLRPWSTEVPAPSLNYAPCGSNDTSISDTFKKLACAAEEHKIYVAISLIERKNCSGKVCRLDGLSYYVTSVIFDRNGIIISRYRKSNVLRRLDKFNVLNPPEMLTFTTDFGVTFGHIICFDIVFQKPWINIARQLNVTDFVLHSAWFVTLPFLSTIQVYAGWSYAEDVNFLASGYNEPHAGDAGTGIFAGRQGIITAVMALGEHSELLIADVPKKSKKIPPPSTLYRDSEGHVRLVAKNEGYQIRNASFRNNDSGFFKILNDTSTLEDAKTKLIAENGFVVEELSHNGIECKFEANVTNLGPSETYRLIAYDGPLLINEFSIGTRICSIVQCVNDTLSSCGQIYNSSMVFQSVAVTAIYVDNENITIVPDSLGTNHFPLRNWVFDQHKQGEHVHTYMLLPRPTRDVMTFGVWGRNFNEDFYITR